MNRADYTPLADMKKDINNYVDFKRLKRSNDLCWKWAQRFGVNSHGYTSFAVCLRDRFQEHKDKLEVRYRCQFVKDFKIMFYAAESEEFMIKQYSAMILSILKKYKIPHNEHEDCLTEGMIAIRNATWNFRNIGVKASFTTYCYNSIMFRIRGMRLKTYKKRQRREARFNVANATDLSAKFNFNIFPKKYSVIEDEPDQHEEIEKVLEMCKLTEKECFLIKCFINRYQGRSEDRSKGLWYTEFAEKFRNPKENTKYSRQGIYNQLVRVQLKILHIMKKAEQAPQDYQLPLSLKGLRNL